LAEYQVTVPEVGTIRAMYNPITILTSNRTRELGDGIRRRCLYLYLDCPSVEKEVAILELKAPGIKTKLAYDIAKFMKEIRQNEDLVKKPGVSETLDWASALLLLNKEDLDPQTVEKTLSCLIKSAEDINKIKQGRLETALAKVREA
jgi:MoxR-like ATPase